MWEYLHGQFGKWRMSGLDLPLGKCLYRTGLENPNASLEENNTEVALEGIDDR